MRTPLAITAMAHIYRATLTTNESCECSVYRHINLLHIPTHVFEETFVSHGKTLPQVVLINLETLLTDCKDSLEVKSSALKACCLVCAYCIVTYQNPVECNQLDNSLYASICISVHCNASWHPQLPAHHDSACLRESHYESALDLSPAISGV